MTAELQLDFRTQATPPVGSGAVLGGIVNPNDVWMTPPPIAADIVNRFKPTGRILDPCRGDGAFWNVMPGAEWCEAREGRNSTTGMSRGLDRQQSAIQHLRRLYDSRDAARA